MGASSCLVRALVRKVTEFAALKALLKGAKVVNVNMLVVKAKATKANNFLERLGVRFQHKVVKVVARLAFEGIIFGKTFP